MRSLLKENKHGEWGELLRFVLVSSLSSRHFKAHTYNTVLIQAFDDGECHFKTRKRVNEELTKSI